MAFADAARARTKPAGMPCSVCALLASVDDDLRAEIQEALDDPAINSRAIHAELVARDLNCSYQMVGRHRRNQCAGPRP